jgi:hypothetical protein
MRTENTVEFKEIAPGAFLDIEAAFDRTSFAAITESAERHGVGSAIVRWINTIFEIRRIIATLSRETLEMSATRGFIAGGACFRPFCGAWPWTSFLMNSMKEALVP